MVATIPPSRDYVVDRFGIWYGVRKYKIQMRKDSKGHFIQIPNSISLGPYNGRIIYPGHKAKDCNFESVCSLCGVTGHTFFSCPGSYVNKTKTSQRRESTDTQQRLQRQQPSDTQQRRQPLRPPDTQQSQQPQRPPDTQQSQQPQQLSDAQQFPDARQLQQPSDAQQLPDARQLQQPFDARQRQQSSDASARSNAFL
ncbi:hypothetical protein D5F01_LYC00861 [Larimichthys crocea]|uniref:Zinc finger CCHC domain-containing protein n=1 Tax=Larimichthys crocea TaxID=215358 RepID=A0A6G0JAT9_LARCR|nr:hypothetical protein D5F01_LYC00861 [Larimichthys crocea]